MLRKTAHLKAKYAMTVSPIDLLVSFFSMNIALEAISMAYMP